MTTLNVNTVGDHQTISYTGQIAAETVAVSGTYRLAIDGAAGGTVAGYHNTGAGAALGGDIYLTAGEKLEIVVGGAGASYPGFGGAGGGGGTFLFDVVGASDTLLAVAGGGGGAAEGNGGGGGLAAQSSGANGNGLGGRGGAPNAAGGGGQYGGGGGGYGGGDGGSQVSYGAPGQSPGTDFLGGAAGSSGANGGFGGGGGGGNGGGGGGGGYGGGGGGGGQFYVHGSSGAGVGGFTVPGSGGGGGGSYLAGLFSNLTQASGAHAGDGLVSFTLDSTAACYCPGSLVLTDRGEIEVEALSIGDLVITVSGAARPIKWIGTRAYSARFARNNANAHPIGFKAGSLADNAPHTDLWVSPKHAMLLDGVLIPAERLVNGVTIVRPSPTGEVRYFHVELESHDVLIVNGAASESFIDDNSRAMFHNCASHAALYPDEPRREAVFCAPRVETGDALARVRQRLALRAGLPASQIELGALEGEIERLDVEGLCGWARDAASPEACVCLDVRLDGEWLGYAYAHEPRAGGGRAFRFRPDSPLAAERLRDVVISRSSDGAVLAHSARAA